MENDQRLTPLPVTTDLQPTQIDYPFNYSASYDDSLESKRSIRQYINVVIKRLPIILGITVLVTAAAAIYSYRQPSIFQAQTSIIIEPRKPEVTRKDVININFGNDQTYYNTQLKLLQSHDLMKRVVIALGLHREPNLFAGESRGLLATLKGLFGGSNQPDEDANMLPVVSEENSDPMKAGEIQLSPEESRRADMYASILVAGLRVEQVERTNIVNISVTSTKPALAAKVADKVAELFIKEDIERETSGALKAYEDLAKSIEDLKATIIKQENEYLEQMRAANLPLQEKGGDLRASNLEALLSQWRTAYDDANKIQTLYTAALNASGKGDILSVVGDNKAIQDARSQNLKRRADLEKRIEDMDRKILEAREKRQTLLAKYTEEYREVQAIDAQIRELEAQKAAVSREVSAKITEEGKKLEADAEREVLASLRAQLSAAQQREARARAAFEAAAAKANFEGQAETKLIGLKREIESNRSLLDTYIQRQKEQELAIASGRPDNIKIQSNAVTPTQPIGPQRTRNILVAMLVALAAGVGLAFLLDYLDDSVRTSDDISRHLGLPTLALIPHQSSGEKRKLLAGGSRNGPVSGPTNALITLDDRTSPMAEAYRHLRTSLLFSSAGKPPQTILVTSAQPSEGKTTTAINTAITLAQADADVIIIDCDLRRPRLHSHFEMENSRGITNYLSGDRDLDSILRPYDELPKLKVITSGPIPPNPAELLSSNEMRHLLEELCLRFKHVIIDSPPAISFTDAAILSTLVDGVVLVAMANKSSIHLMRQFKQRVHNMGARIYGVVLNGIRSGSVEYDYYGTGYYHYYSRSSEDTSTPFMDDRKNGDA
jgi:capsular exopolysaccharide synthesis family protein